MVCWRCEEIMDLLAIWSEKMVQQALRQREWNIDIHKDIAKSITSLFMHMSEINKTI